MNTMNDLSLHLFVIAVCVAAVNSAIINPVCYSYLGCFSMDDPWFSAARPFPAPQSPEFINTQFRLYTRTQSSSYFLITKTPDISMTGSTYDGTKPTFFIVPGFFSNADLPWVTAMKDAILKEFDANVIVVDWTTGSTQINYLQVASNTRVVGKELTRLAKYLVSDKGAAVSRYHFVGHSLGAHISGYVGKDIPNIARITGLDVAQPGFEGYSETVRLTINDAAFVEAIHTNARPFIPTLGFGYMQPLGHVDFYVNGGADQPGCTLPTIPSDLSSVTSLASLANVTMDVLKKYVFCPHARAFYVFTASVANKGCTFWGHKATLADVTLSWASAGYLTQLLNFKTCTKTTCSPLGLQTTIYPARGVFLVKTTGSDAYCIQESNADTIMAPFKTIPTALI